MGAAYLVQMGIVGEAVSDADPKGLLGVPRPSLLDGLHGDGLGEANLQIKGLKDVEADGAANVSRHLGIAQDALNQLLASTEKSAQSDPAAPLYEGRSSGSLVTGIGYWCSRLDDSGTWKETWQTKIFRPFCRAWTVRVQYDLPACGDCAVLICAAE